MCEQICAFVCVPGYIVQPFRDWCAACRYSAKMKLFLFIVTMPRPVAGVAIQRFVCSTLILRSAVTPRRSSADMQHSGFFDTQHGDQLGPAVDQCCAQVVLNVVGSSGVTGYRYNGYRYRYLPYTLRNGEDQVLSRWNMVDRAMTVSRQQCTVAVSANGIASLTSTGKGPTLWRDRGGPWCAVQRAESLVLADGDQVSLDCNDPEAAVFTCHVDYAQQEYTHQGYPQDLPAGWVSGLDESSGAIYYYNEQTGHSQWEPPQPGSVPEYEYE